MPLITDLFPMLEMQQFKPFTEVKMNLEVENGNGSVLSCGSASKCDVKYRWDYTPLWSEISPKVLVPMTSAVLFVKPERAMEYKVAGQLPLDWKVDGTSVDMTSYVNTGTELWRWGTNYIKGKVLSGDRNMNVDIDVSFAGVGKAWKEFEDGRHCNVLQTDCYTARVHPTITQISKSSGYNSGGQVLVLRGTSLDASSELEITVDGTPCRLLSNNKYEIFCETGAH